VVTVGSGTVAIRAPRVNDKRVAESGERRRFSSRILPAYARRSPKVGDVLAVLYGQLVVPRRGDVAG
jgi:putative transposase